MEPMRRRGEHLVYLEQPENYIGDLTSPADNGRFPDLHHDLSSNGHLWPPPRPNTSALRFGGIQTWIRVNFEKCFSNQCTVPHDG
jgi:hypothetical protein